MAENEARNGKHWTAEEIAFLKENWKLPLDELSEKLGRSATSIRDRGYTLGLYREKWTQEDDDYLQDKWGTVSIPGIAKHLGRTEAAIMNRVQELGLSPWLESGSYISFNQLYKALFGSNSHSYQRKSWIEGRGFPIHYKKRGKCSYKVVYLEEFWEWAEKNRSFLDFSKMEPLALGEEPPWVAEQRKKDFHAFRLQRKDPWTPEEDEKLKTLLKQHKYGYKELSEMLHRSAGAIQRRVLDLGIKERPVKACSNAKENQWSDETYAILADGIRHGDSYSAIGQKLGKSEKAIRGKVYYTYLTENADKIREMMGDGPWGAGAPVPTVKQAVVLSRTRTDTKAKLAQLCGVLCYRTQQLKGQNYDRYFQRAMCVNWDDIHGECKADCEDCDSCTEFIRIRPQYCVRCGATFFERAENRVCQPCRAARRKMAYKKYRHLRKGGAKMEEDTE